MPTLTFHVMQDAGTLADRLFSLLRQPLADSSWSDRRLRLSVGRPSVAGTHRMELARRDLHRISFAVLLWPLQMDSRKVTSREYKMLLRPKRFEGGEAALRLKARKFWETFSSAVSDVVIKTHGTPDEVNAQRLITFLDTSKRHLDAGRYIFRERKKPDGTKPEVTLKFRHADRHVSQDRNMSSIRGESKTKFEEDIKGPDVKKAPFVSLYSFSTTVKGLDRREFPRLKELRALFPDLGDRLDDFQGNRPLAPVGRFTVYEVVLTGGFLTIGKDPLVDAECALIVWYDHAVKVLRRPLLVEFSYRYGNDEEQYGGTMSGRAYSVFRALQTRLEAWVDPKAATKTAFVYG